MHRIQYISKSNELPPNASRILVSGCLQNFCCPLIGGAPIRSIVNGELAIVIIVVKSTIYVTEIEFRLVVHSV